MIESLEVRTLLAATLDAGTGVLTITGTDANDRIQIFHSWIQDATHDNVERYGVRIGDETTYFKAARVRRIDVHGLDGDDYISARLGFMLPTATVVPLRILGGAGHDTIFSGQGNDTVRGGPGNDRLRAGDGRDLVYGNAGDDDLHGDEGHDTLLGNDGADSLRGAAGNDVLIGGDGTDLVNAGAGDDDVFTADSHADTASGGPGLDGILKDPADAVTGFNRAAVAVKRRILD